MDRGACRLQSEGSQIFGHELVTKQQQQAIQVKGVQVADF